MLPPQPPLQLRLHSRPLRINHAEIHRMPNPPARREHVIPKNPFLLRPDPQNRIPRFLIQRIRLQLHAHASQIFKRMPQQQILRLGIDRRPLPRRRNPRRSNLQSPMRLLNIHIPRAADHPPARPLDLRKRHRHAVRPLRSAPARCTPSSAPASQPASESTATIPRQFRSRTAHPNATAPAAPAAHARPRAPPVRHESVQDSSRNSAQESPQQTSTNLDDERQSKRAQKQPLAAA